MNIARPPIKLIYFAYLIASLVPNVPINNQQEATSRLKAARKSGFQCFRKPAILKTVSNHLTFNHP